MLVGGWVGSGLEPPIPPLSQGPGCVMSWVCRAGDDQRPKAQHHTQVCTSPKPNRA